jgi:hypothetical protein
MLRLKRLDCNCRGADRIDEAGKQLETYGRMDTRSGQWGCIDKTMNLQSRRRGGEEKTRDAEAWSSRRSLVALWPYRPSLNKVGKLKI